MAQSECPVLAALGAEVAPDGSIRKKQNKWIKWGLYGLGGYITYKLFLEDLLNTDHGQTFTDPDTTAQVDSNLQPTGFSTGSRDFIDPNMVNRHIRALDPSRNSALQIAGVGQDILNKARVMSSELAFFADSARDIAIRDINNAQAGIDQHTQQLANSSDDPYPGMADLKEKVIRCFIVYNEMIAGAKAGDHAANEFLPDVWSNVKDLPELLGAAAGAVGGAVGGAAAKAAGGAVLGFLTTPFGLLVAFGGGYLIYRWYKGGGTQKILARIPGMRGVDDIEGIDAAAEDGAGVPMPVKSSISPMLLLGLAAAGAGIYYFISQRQSSQNQLPPASSVDQPGLSTQQPAPQPAPSTGTQPTAGTGPQPTPPPAPAPTVPGVFGTTVYTGPGSGKGGN